MASKILIVEDDIFLGDVLLRKLQSEGYQAELIRDGAQAVGALKKSKPDLLLLDIILPNVNGYEILEQKFKDSSIQNIPTIIISNSGQPVEINRVLALGVKDYLVKAQFDPQDVISKVRQQLRSGKQTGSENGQTSSNSQNGAGKSGSVAAAGAKTKTLEGKKLLWVEDDVFLSEIIARKLSAAGCKLIHASNGEEALSQVEKEMPDIILLDILLSGIDGFEILKRLKENVKVKKIPVILLSNLGQKSDTEKGQKLGAEAFLVKATVTLDEIIDEIVRVVNKRVQ